MTGSVLLPERRRLLLAAALAGAGLAGGAEARAQVGARSASDRLNDAGPEARALAARAGLWDVTETVWAGAGLPPTVSTGLVAERRMLGTMLQEIIHSPGDASAVKRTDLLVYDRLEGQWQYVSFDARAPVGLMPATSLDAGDGRSIELVFAPFAVPGSGAEPTGQLLRMRQVIGLDAPDRDSKRQYFVPADGSGRSWLAHQYAYVRRP